MNRNTKYLILNTSQKGFSTLELLIATAIILTAISGVILIVFGNQTVSLDNQVNNEGLMKAQDMIEQARASASADFNSLGDSSAYDFFGRELLVTDINPCKKTAIASVSWSTDGNRPQLINIETTFTNPAEAIALGGDCGPSNPPPTGWQNIVCSGPSSPTWDFSPSGIPPKGLDLIRRPPNTYAAITGIGSSAGQKDFWIVNVTDRVSLGVGAVGIETGTGLNDVVVVGNYAFAASNTTSKQLRVIDISNLAAPFEIMAASRSLNTAGSGTEGQKIFYYDKKIYIGTNYIAPAPKEFQVFDVSNPISPSLVGAYNVNHNIYDITVRNEIIGGVSKTLAYLALSDSVGNDPKFIALDVTIPAFVDPVVPFGSFNPSPDDTQYGTALYLLGNYAYLGRQYNTGSNRNNDLFSLNINDPSLVSFADSVSMGMGSNNEARALVASGPLLFVANTDNNVGFQVWDINNPNDIKDVANCKYPQEPSEMEFDGNFIYVVNRSNAALRIIYDATNPFP